MLNPQVLPTPIELVKLQLHLAPHLLWLRRDLVLPGRRGKCAYNPIGINPISPELVLRGVQ
jgi:hypothetical protein